ncbi:MAG: ATP-binding cassette domain-containing protein [Deltaproteobacteria bacterium]|nr:ATP-binding cassette domain-containing protein [Deltaproteobacteria bacterium]
MNSDIVLYTGRLTKRFKNVIAVEDLDLSVSRGDIFGFLGPNGAGKSTTIRMLLGLIRPTDGEIRLFNRSLENNRKDLLGRIGALVEKPSFYNYLSARRNLEIFATLTNRRPDPRDIDRVLDIVALLHRADDKVKTYSHGMKQRLGVAQALLGNPELIILDEPTAGLDPKGIKEIRRLIIELAQQGLTVFLSSHILHEVEQMCRNMAIINKGRLVVHGGVKELLNSDSDIFSVKVDRPGEAADLLKTREWVESVEALSGAITVKIKEQQVPVMTELLVQSGFHIFAIQPQRSLENYFLSLLGADNV